MTTKSKKSKKEPEVSFYTNKKGEKKCRFRHRYYDSLGYRKEKPGQGFSSENAAIQALLQVKTEIANDNVKKVEADQLTVAEWMD
ncbi:Arm DNA-binding domain-containing protein [Domibacillus indicus]|uniref:Arm DNA-binding domain-containing protein n=1 Tax=Domibacillus indicus TaxID=1437523 RepID=UPI00203B7D5F|nr:Arm DNA-binding domain-containing protein [Domibacillus indicus]MCM3791058.1 Arm DNA-binding domain-containing protein [Domibacillus indicus]